MQRPADKLFVTTPFDEQVLLEVNRQAFHRTSSGAFYQRHFGNRFDAEDTLFVIIGTDSGLLPQWLLQRDPAPGSRYLFIELPAIIDAVRTHSAGLFADERLALGTADDWPELQKRYRLDEYLYLDRVILVESVGAADAHMAEYRALSYDLGDQLSDHRHKVRIRLGNQNFIRRQLENVADNLWPAAFLKGCLEGRAAVLIGGGPSLDELLPWIIEQRDRLLVIAISRVCRQLLQAKLTPDVVVSIDPQEISFDISKEMMRLSGDTIFVHAYHASPLLVGQWHGSAFYCGDKFPWKGPANVDNLPAAGPTVTNAGLALAVYVGCRTVVLAGVDLCYTRDGHTHASGSNERLIGARLGIIGRPIETNGGWLTRTDPTMFMAALHMSQQAAQAGAAGCRVINPASSAARIEHVEHLPVNDIELAAMGASPGEQLRRKLPVEGAQQVAALLQATAKELARANRNLRKILHLINEALACNARLHRPAGGSGNFKYKKRMDVIESKLDRNFADITSLIKNFAAAGFLRLVRPGRRDDWSREELKTWADRYYHTYRSATEALLSHLEAAQRRVGSRLGELEPNPNISELVEQWDTDGTPGRARLVLGRLENGSDRELAALECLREQNAKFQSIIDERDTAQARHCEVVRQRRLGAVRTKLTLLFGQHDREELRLTANYLAEDPEPEAAELRSLALGYLGELDHEYDEAFAHYQHVVDASAESLAEHGLSQDNQRLEDALRRMSFIALTQGDAATAASLLDVLAAISPEFEPQYADALRLAGRTDEAAKVYVEYLERVPGDLLTMLKLGRLFHAAGILESARWAYEYVIERDPANTDARHLRDQLGG